MQSYPWAFYEVKTASHIEKIIQPPPSKHKLLLQKFSDGYLQECIDICFPTALKRQFLGAQKWCSASVLYDINQRQVFWKFEKWVRFLAVLLEYIFIMLSEVRFVRWSFLRETVLCWCCAGDLFGSETPVTTGGFEWTVNLLHKK